MSVGPLKGIKIVEMPAVGPLPLCATIFAELGATIIRIDRPARLEVKNPVGIHIVNRAKLGLDLKQPGASDIVLDLVKNADVILEGYRPGVMERLGLSPEACFAANPRIVYGRMTGWGQTGPLAKTPGHDLNYLALSGILSQIGTPEEPIIPLNLLGDYAGGSMLLALGVLAAIIEAQKSGQGQVIDVAMLDGINLIASVVHQMYARGFWKLGRRNNLLDGAAPFYRIYPCSDGKWIAVGPTEMKFRATLGDAIGVPELGTAASADPANWAAMGDRMAAIFLTDTRDNWMERLKDVETCITPVLDMNEAPLHPHAIARNSFEPMGTGYSPMPAPRFSRTPGAPCEAPPLDETLAAFGTSAATIEQRLTSA